jgi:hypothetical protein
MKNFIIAILSVVVVVLLVLMLTKQNTQAPTMDDTQIESSEEVQTNESDQNSASGTNAEFTAATVFLHAPQPEMIPCVENLTMISKTVTFPETQAVLTASLQELLQVTEDSMDEQVQNWFSNERGFTLNSVTINNGVAQVRLNHAEELPFSSDCQYIFLKEQVARTANQYPTVSTTEVFINDLEL